MLARCHIAHVAIKARGSRVVVYRLGDTSVSLLPRPSSGAACTLSGMCELLLMLLLQLEIDVGTISSCTVSWALRGIKVVRAYRSPALPSLLPSPNT